ncbi:tail protein [Xenorhabdus mauleonii]|uniref:Phage tail fibre repeat-containing protein n=1 Tax=Xenorhabdus mauleonii TaxID=351675 RepID=A0A1I3MVU8_9GAMM|nr:phage tail protein [Xenorhabdus mauleonii]PHM45864.1 tail protein [Xenorhabdus mauleonii]SFJ01108.1 Phage tail fibre repeat-containing protein [Xenorhabdus mauleonii]
MSIQDSKNSVEVPTMDDVRKAIEEHAQSRNHPYATQTEPGFVTLSNETDSDSELTVATSKAVKTAYDLANTANNNASNRVPIGRTVNGYLLSADVILRAKDVGAYTKEETDFHISEVDALAITANQNAISANINAEGRLSKNQNGADIPDKAEFVKNIGLENTLKIGDFGIGGGGVEVRDGQTLEDLAGKTGFYQKGSDQIPTDSPLPHAMKYLSIGPKKWATQLAFDAYSNNAWIRSRKGQFNSTFHNWSQFSILGVNTFMDANGNFKLSSAIINLWSDGKFETNNESEGATVDRISEGVYLIKGVIGFNADGTMNNIEIPSCQNKLPLIWVDHEILPNSSIKLMTYHREHSDAPAFARNIREGYSDGDLIDIPEGRFISVRVKMSDTQES